MRKVIFSQAFEEFYDAQPAAVQAKLDYAVNALGELRVVSAKLVKKLTGTDFYELRVSMSNEYRVILFAVDHDNITEAGTVVLLNGFVKKSTKDYKKQINTAIKLLEALI
ncbi:MAG: type II toxin-antitoxin system RelE/ParE family toxin [Alistipes sp.]|jgi:phage-related protein|nr:type II toxin-antitoxin system RelE/ParE family toxin [Alistipes sp.]